MKASWNLATPKDDKKPPEPTVLLADVHSETAVGRLLRLDACFEPSALLAMAHAKDAKYVVRDGVLTISGDEEAMNLKINISSGRLLELSPAKNCDRQTEGLRFERGALDRRWAEVRKVTAGHTNLFDPKRPAHSFGQYLALDDGLWKVLARANAAVGSSKAPDDPVALRAIRKLLAKGLLDPLDDALADSQSNRDDETFDGLDAGSGWQKGPTGWIAQLTLGATDAVFPRGSWPWTTGRCAAVALAGRGEGAAKEFADLRDSDHCGPVACLAAGTIARWTGVQHVRDACNQRTQEAGRGRFPQKLRLSVRIQGSARAANPRGDCGPGRVGRRRARCHS